MSGTRGGRQPSGGSPCRRRRRPGGAARLLVRRPDWWSGLAAAPAAVVASPGGKLGGLGPRTGGLPPLGMRIVSRIRLFLCVPANDLRVCLVDTEC